MSFSSPLAVLIFFLPSLIHAVPAPTQAAVILPAPRPITTPSPEAPTRTKRDLAGDIKSVLGSLGSDIPSYVASGVPNFFQDFPSGSSVQSSLGLSDAQVSALPLNVLNLPPYGNWTDQGWNVRFHGNVYKQPDLNDSTLDNLANIFLIGTQVQSLPPSQQSQARNLTAEIFVIQQKDVGLKFHLSPSNGTGGDGEVGGGGAVNGSTDISADVDFPYLTDAEGDYDAFVPINSTGLVAGNTTDKTQRLDVHTNGTVYGNATAYLVPEEGFTFVSDIDDILRVTQIYEPKKGLLNSFALPFTPWMNMPDIYRNWSSSGAPYHFHYLTTTPEQITANYMAFIYANYPGGSFDTRPLNFSDVSATLSIRKFLLEKIFQTYPKRKFVLIADTSNSDVMKDYPAMATEFPGQVQCILLRNTTSTDSGDKFPYDTSGFKNLNQKMYMFFKVPDDLVGLDIAGGNCLNASIPQNVTFGIQDSFAKGGTTSTVPSPKLALGVIAALLAVLVGSGP